jgi:hypothetical protein
MDRLQIHLWKSMGHVYYGTCTTRFCTALDFGIGVIMSVITIYPPILALLPDKSSIDELVVNGAHHM